MKASTLYVATVLLSLAIFTSCQGLTDYLNTPVTDEGLSVTYEDPATGARFVLEAPVGQEPEPIEIEMDGVTVTIVPVPIADGARTRGDSIAGLVAPVLGAVTGNPFLVQIVSGLAFAGAAGLKRKS